MSEVLILPGLFGSGEGHWQEHWLQDQPGCRRVAQDDWDHPDLDSWLPRLEGALEAAGEAYLVAHSLGCLLAARLAGRSAARHVKGALLVAPCDLPATEILHPGHIAFGGMPTAPLPFPSIVVGSMNDAYMTVDRLALFGRLWKAETRNVGLAGHINIASGFGRWRTGYRLLDALKTRAGDRRRNVSPRPAFAM